MVQEKDHGGFPHVHLLRLPCEFATSEGQSLFTPLPRIETPVALAVLADSVAGRCNDLFEASVPLW
jgi:hypothetical protein